MTTTATERVSARERLLAAADELFYEEGVNTVGIDRIIERAGVAKATLYSAFGSKEELIRAYLRRRFDGRQAIFSERLAMHADPDERLLAVFDVLEETIGRPGFRGCAFVRANREARPGGAIDEITDEYRSWVSELFTDLARAAGFAEPTVVARHLALLYDGALVSSRLDHDPAAALAAKAIAHTVMSAAPRA